MPRKQVRRKSWFGTDNSYSKKKSVSIKNALMQDPQVVRAIVSIEKGKNAKKNHYQFYIELKSGKTLSAMQKKYFSGDKAHLEKRKGTPWEAWRYCSDEKDDGTFIKQLVIVGNPPEETYTKKKSVWPAIMDRIDAGASLRELRLEFLNTVPRYYKYINELIYQRDIIQYKNRYRPLSVHWWYGSTRTGKTRAAMESVDEPHLIHRVSDYKNPWDTYDGQKVVLLDEFTGQVKLSDLLQLLDNYYPELPCRYHNKIGLFDTVIICSNLSFEEIYYDNDYFSLRKEQVAALLHRITDFKKFGVEKRPSSLLDDYDDVTAGIWGLDSV